MFGAPSRQVFRLAPFLVDGILHRQPRSRGGRRGWEWEHFLRAAMGANTAAISTHRPINGFGFMERITCSIEDGPNCAPVGVKPPGRRISCDDHLPGAPGFSNASMAWSMVKLAGFCRGGKSLKVMSVLPTMFWTGTAMKARRYHQSL